MYPWRELYSMSTSSSAVLFSHHQLLIARLQYREPMSPCPFLPAGANNFSFPSSPKTWSISLGPEIERVWFSSHSSLSFTLYDRARRRRCCFFACLSAAREHLAHISNFYFISLNIVFLYYVVILYCFPQIDYLLEALVPTEELKDIVMYIPWGGTTVQFSSAAQSCLTLCDPMDCSTPGLPIHHQLLEFTQTHVHWVGDAIQPSLPLSSPSLAFNLSQHQVLFLL